MCDCINGIRFDHDWLGGEAYPCPDCTHGEQMAVAEDDWLREKWSVEAQPVKAITPADFYRARREALPAWKPLPTIGGRAIRTGKYDTNYHSQHAAVYAESAWE